MALDDVNFTRDLLALEMRDLRGRAVRVYAGKYGVRLEVQDGKADLKAHHAAVLAEAMTQAAAVASSFRPVPDSPPGPTGGEEPSRVAWGV